MSMEGIPYTPHTLIHARDRLPRPLQLLTTRALQQLGLLQDLAWLHVSHTDSALLAVDVGAADDGVAARTRRDGDFDAGVLAGEGGEGGGEEGAVVSSCQSEEWRDGRLEEGALHLLHAFAAAGPVAVVEVEALALEDECADAILVRC